jgi:hypothetical protein
MRHHRISNALWTALCCGVFDGMFSEGLAGQRMDRMGQSASTEPARPREQRSVFMFDGHTPSCIIRQ